MANLKNITDIPVVESAEGLNLIVNDNGAAKQIAASAVGKVKTVNGVEPDVNGNIEINITYDVIIEVEEHFESATASTPICTFNVIRGSFAELAAKLKMKKPITGYIFVTRNDIADLEILNFYTVTGASPYFETGDSDVLVFFGRGGDLNDAGYTVRFLENGSIIGPY